MFRKHLFKTSIFFSIILLTVQISCLAEEARKGGIGSRNNYRFSCIPIYQFETDLDSGGQFNVQRHFLRFDASLDYDYSE